MVSNKSVRNVLRMVTAGKEEAPAAPVAPAAPETPTVPTSTERTTVHYYFFEAPTGSSIPFKDMDSIINGNNEAAKNLLMNNLSTGISGKNKADHFKWLKVAVATDQFNGKWAVYECELEPSGIKSASGDEKITPEDVGITAADAGKKLSVFTPLKNNMTDFVAIDTSQTSSKFFNQKPPENLTASLLSRKVLPGGTNYDGFKMLLDTYRIWSEPNGRLILPTGEIPDDSYGQYPGGDKAFKEIEAKVQKSSPQAPQTPQQPSLGDQERSKQQEGESRFSPVDEQVKAGVAPVQGQYIDTPVGGGRTMSAHNINSVRRVLLGYFKGAIDTVQPSTMNTTNTTKRKPLYVSDKSQENAALGATLTQYAKTQADLEKKTDQLTKNMAQRAQSMGRL